MHSNGSRDCGPTPLPLAMPHENAGVSPHQMRSVTLEMRQIQFRMERECGEMGMSPPHSWLPSTPVTSRSRRYLVLAPPLMLASSSATTASAWGRFLHAHGLPSSSNRCVTGHPSTLCYGSRYTWNKSIANILNVLSKCRRQEYTCHDRGVVTLWVQAREQYRLAKPTKQDKFTCKS